MKKIAVLILFLCSSVCFAQRDVIKFLGIPVDGTREEMISAIKNLNRFQYFRYETNDSFLGKFNGVDSFITISYNNGLVDRVFVWEADPRTLKETVKAYNTLIDQFSKNDKYVDLLQCSQMKIQPGENVRRNMRVNGLTYEARFFYIPDMEERERVLKTVDGMSFSDRIDYVFDYAERNMVDIVWFRINKIGIGARDWSIPIYYENTRNRPHEGEDL